jgi:uncharacterized damage-inducible protein DinB
MLMTESKTLMDAITVQWRDGVKPTLNQAFELAPDDKLTWAPADNMRTLGQVFFHIGNTSSAWYDSVMKELPWKPFPPDYMPHREVIAQSLKDHWERLERLFSEPPEALEKIYTPEHYGKTYNLSGYWVFIHLFEHDLHHRSQINQYLRILGIDPPKI